MCQSSVNIAFFTELPISGGFHPKEGCFILCNYRAGLMLGVERSWVSTSPTNQPLSVVARLNCFLLSREGQFWAKQIRQLLVFLQKWSNGKKDLPSYARKAQREQNLCCMECWFSLEPKRGVSKAELSLVCHSSISHVHRAFPARALCKACGFLHHGEWSVTFPACHTCMCLCVCKLR